METTEGKGFGRCISILTFPILKTDRLTLRPLVMTDAAALHVAFVDKDLMTWWSSAPHNELNETEAYLEVNVHEDRYMTWAITYENDEALGWVVLLDHRSRVKEIGYILRRSHWGKGIAYEAVSRIIKYGFEDLELRRIIADTDPDNTASNSLLKNMGFQKEGYLREEWETHLGVRDSIMWGLLKRDWLAGK